VLALDELVTNEPGSLTRGMGYTVPQLAEEIKDLCKRWKMAPAGCADDACFAKGGHQAGSIADEFQREGVRFARAQKRDRRTGWERMRRLMADAGKPDRPGLYLANGAAYFWRTVPTLPRDPRKPDDVDTRSPDHGADALRYGIGFCPFEPRAVKRPW
jgi:hypothetical protein